MHSDRVKQISAELSRLFEQQMEFLETRKLAELTDGDLRGYHERNQRISELTTALNQLNKAS